MIPLKIGGAAIIILICLNELSFLFYLFFVLFFVCFNVLYDSGKETSVARSGHRRCSVRKGVLRNFAKFTGKRLCQNLFFNKVACLRPCTGTGAFL